jgi:hypothetical protein
MIKSVSTHLLALQRKLWFWKFGNITPLWFYGLWLFESRKPSLSWVHRVTQVLALLTSLENTIEESISKR